MLFFLGEQFQKHSRTNHFENETLGFQDSHFFSCEAVGNNTSELQEGKYTFTTGFTANLIYEPCLFDMDN